MAVQCQKHNHSSPETAIACRAKSMQISADRKILRSGALYNMSGYRLITHNPPKLVLAGNIEVWYFYSGESK
jgi:hypothetical protein